MSNIVLATFLVGMACIVVLLNQGVVLMAFILYLITFIVLIIQIYFLKLAINQFSLFTVFCLIFGFILITNFWGTFVFFYPFALLFFFSQIQPLSKKISIPLAFLMLLPIIYTIFDQQFGTWISYGKGGAYLTISMINWLGSFVVAWLIPTFLSLTGKFNKK